MLISVNPFKDLGIYTDEILKSYVGKNRLEVSFNFNEALNSTVITNVNF